MVLGASDHKHFGRHRLSLWSWISAIVDVSSGHGAGTASYVNVDVSKFVIRLMKY